MKLNKLFLLVLGALVMSSTFTACSDDESWDPMGQGSKVSVAETRAYILNEGKFKNNDSGITYFDWNVDTTYNHDFYMAQNAKQLGDSGRDIIVDGNNIYMAVYGSNYIAKLNSMGVEQTRTQLPEELGQVRYLAAEGGYLYVTCYGGYVAKLQASDLKYVSSVTVGANPEYIVVDNGTIYCTNSGWGSDNRVAIINANEFKTAEFKEVMPNPDNIIKFNGRIFVQGYGAAYDYPWGELDMKTGEFTQIGNATAWASFGDVIYTVNSVTDWSTYETTNYFYTYHVSTGKLEEVELKNAPEALTNTSVYGMSVNPYTGHLYIMTTDYTNNSTIYHFDTNLTFLKEFESTGVCSRKIVFLK